MALAAAGAPVCGACGEPLRPSPEEIREAKAERLLHYHRDTADRLRAMAYGDACRWVTTPELLAMLARVKGYRPGWVKHCLREME